MVSHLISHDPRFRTLGQRNVALQQIASGMLWTEGPVYMPQGNYYLWSDIPNDRVYQWVEGMEARVFDYNPRNSNGHTLDRQGRLISCEHRGRQVTRREHDGSTKVLVDSFEGKRLNSPNDVVVKSDGSVWFSDPSYGILTDYEGKRSEQEQAGCYVFRYDPETGDIRIVADDFVKPNGLAFSPDESLLYVSDTGQSHDADGPRHIRVFDVDEMEGLSNSRVFADIQVGMSDGFRLDIDGNVWTSCGSGVQVFSPDGDMLAGQSGLYP